MTFIFIYIYIYLFIIYPSNDLICRIVNLAQVFAVWRWYIVIITCIVWLSNKAICTWFFPSLVLKRLYDAWYDADVQPPASPICNLFYLKKVISSQRQTTPMPNCLQYIYIYIYSSSEFVQNLISTDIACHSLERKLIGFTMWNLRMLSLYIQMLQAAPFK